MSEILGLFIIIIVLSFVIWLLILIIGWMWNCIDILNKKPKKILNILENLNILSIDKLFECEHDEDFYDIEKVIKIIKEMIKCE